MGRRVAHFSHLCRRCCCAVGATAFFVHHLRSDTSHRRFAGSGRSSRRRHLARHRPYVCIRKVCSVARRLPDRLPHDVAGHGQDQSPSILAWVPVGLFLGAVIGWRDSDGPLAGTVFTVRIFLLWIAALPIFAAGHFSKRTNDTTNLRLVTLAIFLFFGVVFGVLLVGVGIFGLAAPLPLALAAPPAMALIALAGWALYRRFYERGRVDLLSTRPR
jgi:hypothetical protein